MERQPGAVLNIDNRADRSKIRFPVDRFGPQFDPVVTDMDKRRMDQGNFPENTCAGVPAAIWRFGIVDRNLQPVRRAEFHIAREIHEERRIAVRVEIQTAAVQRYGCPAVYTVKIHIYSLSLPLGRDVDHFFICACASREMSRGPVRFRTLRDSDLHVVRQIDLNLIRSRIVPRNPAAERPVIHDGL